VHKDRYNGFYGVSTRIIGLNPSKGKEVMRVMLRWDGEMKDRDLFIEYNVSESVSCKVGFFNPLCEGVSGHFDDKDM